MKGTPRTNGDRKRRRIIVLALAGMLAVAPAATLAYILPAEQLVGFMLKNFPGIRGLGITQTVTAVTFDDNETAHAPFHETVRMTAFGGIHVEQALSPAAPLTGPDGMVRPTAQESAAVVWARSDRSFRRLLTAGSWRPMLAQLTDWGIFHEAVSYTRQNGTIAYRIGMEGPAQPALVLEKERFLPLLLRYRPARDNGAGPITVEFSDYRPVAGGWYPYEIACTTESGSIFRCTVTQMTVHE
ncbi:MAG: hypothetical protein JRK53_02320 [Deltaproteobacteria bacterium]|nr:hypothetical protein [Deltaproteobacteria bacterium]MBW1816723.1 hypothetical protein [Deltaproteobacteria bacterium]MBW2282959.1 hypothetical protein [Deltaproteobacteria bacterium]